MPRPDSGLKAAGHAGRTFAAAARQPGAWTAAGKPRNPGAGRPRRRASNAGPRRSWNASRAKAGGRIGTGPIGGGESSDRRGGPQGRPRGCGRRRWRGPQEPEQRRKPALPGGPRFQGAPASQGRRPLAEVRGDRGSTHDREARAACRLQGALGPQRPGTSAPWNLGALKPGARATEFGKGSPKQPQRRSKGTPALPGALRSPAGESGRRSADPRAVARGPRRSGRHRSRGGSSQRPARPRWIP